VDHDPSAARRAAAEFLGGTYDQDFTEFVERVTVSGTLDQAVEGLRAFVRAGVRHIVLLPCSASRSDTLAPWLPDLMAQLRETEVSDG
jgi:hypothetical protein